MATSVGLHTRLTASVDKFERGMQTVEKRLRKVESTSRKSAKGIGTLAKIEIGRTLISGFTKLSSVVSRATTSMNAFFQSAREEIDALGKLATGLDMAVEPLQHFQQLAHLSGLDTKQFEKGVLAMNKRLGEFADGYGPAKRALDDMGVTLAQLDGKDASEQMTIIARAIMAIPDSSVRAAKAFAIFGDAGKKMMPFIKGVAGGVEKIATEGNKMGTFLTETQVRATEDMNDAFTLMYESIVGIGKQIVGNIAPHMTKLVEQAKEFIKNFQFDGQLGGAALADYLTRAFLDAAVMLGDWADGFIAAMTKLFEMFSMMFEKLYGFVSNTLGVNKSVSAGGQEAEERIRSINAQNKILERQIEMHRSTIDSGLDVFGKNAAALAEKTKRLELNTLQRADAVKSMERAEKNYLKKKIETTTGLSSLGDMARKLQQGYLQDRQREKRAGGRQQPERKSSKPFNPRFPLGATDPEQQTQTGLLRQIKDNTNITQVAIA